MNYFITAIGTDSGKTVVSAIFCEALHADYWKPVQAGIPRDTETVQALVTNKQTVFHPEQYLLASPVSPHAAAKKDHTKISLDAFRSPHTNRSLIIEGAGGCLVPLNDSDFIIDLAKKLQARVILVSNHYLGSINHTLLTLEALKHRELPVSGIIFNGDQNKESERIILHHGKLKCLLRIAKEPVIDRDVVTRYAAILKENLHGRTV